MMRWCKNMPILSQKKQAIIDEYDEKRQKAIEHNNQQLIDDWTRRKPKPFKSCTWWNAIEPELEKMFGNLDEIFYKEIGRIVGNDWRTNGIPWYWFRP